MSMNEGLMNENVVNEDPMNENRVNEECSICLSKIDENSYLTNCNHAFCQSCLEEWFQTNHISCPLCRGQITECNHNKENTRIKIYSIGNQVVNNEDNLGLVVDVDRNDLIIQLRRDNDILRNIYKRYHYTFVLLFTFYIWNRWDYYIISQNYSNLLSSYKLVNITYNECLAREQCSYDLHNVIDEFPVSVYSRNKLLGICMIPIEFILSCIIK